MGAQWYDGLITIPGCDKNMPGCLMAMGRLNRPALMIYGGTIKPGCGDKGEKLDIVSAFQSYGDISRRQDQRRYPQEGRAEVLSRSGCLRRHVHSQHDGQRHRSDGDEPALQLFDPC